MGRVEVKVVKGKGGARVEIQGVDFSANAITGVEGNYLSELEKYYSPSSAERQAIKILFSKIRPFIDSIKLLYLFVGDNKEAQGINAVNPDKYSLDYLSNEGCDKKGMILNKQIVVNTQYAPSDEELKDMTMIGMGDELSSRNGTFIGYRYGSDSRRIGIMNSFNDSPAFYYVPNSGGAYNTSYISFLRNYRLKKWVGATVNKTTATLLTSYKATKTRDISNDSMTNPSKKVFQIGGETENGTYPIEQGGFQSGYMQSVLFGAYMAEPEVRLIGNALYEFNQTIRNV